MKEIPVGAFPLIKANLAGLPSFSRLVIYDLLEYCDFATGIIVISSLNDFASNDLYVVPSSGRKKEVINANTLRNVFRTIKKAKPEHFKFSTKNQRIIIEMPFLRELYNELHSKNIQVVRVVAADVAGATIQPGHGDRLCFEEELAAVDAADVAAAPLRPIENIKQNTTKQTNKLTAVAESNFSKNKIQPNFQPSQETIDIALSRGLDQVTNQAEIQKFISYNQANNSLWVDFNPVFLTWLEREKEYRQAKQQQQTSKPTRSNNDERTRNQHNSYESVMEQVLRENSDACAPSEHYKTIRIIESELADEQSHLMALGSANEHLRPVIHQSEWEHGQRPMARSASGLNADCIGERHDSY